MLNSMAGLQDERVQSGHLLREAPNYDRHHVEINYAMESSMLEVGLYCVVVLVLMLFRQFTLG